MAETCDEPVKVEFDASKQSDVKVLNLTKKQLETLGIKYKSPQTPAQLERNKKLSEISKKRHEENRRQKEQYEREQLEKFKAKAVVKPKQKYNLEKYEVELNDDSSDDNAMQEYREFQKFKASRQRQADDIVLPKKKAEAEPKQKTKKEKDQESSDDDRIQKKAEKATKVIEAVDKLNNVINKMVPPINPYLDLFNRKK